MHPVADAYRQLGDALHVLAGATFSAIRMAISTVDRPALATFANGDSHRDFTLDSGCVYRSRLATLADIPALRGLERQLVAYERPLDPSIRPGTLYYDMEKLVP